MTDQTTRRALLAGTATAALSGLAGCSSVSTSASDLVGGSETTTASGATGSGSSKYSAATFSEEQTGFGLTLTDRPVLGSSDALVDVYYWTDYQCPFCAQFEENAFPKLVENYVDEGAVRFAMLQLPNIGDASTPAARLDKCVWREVRESNPAAYFDWHAAVFDAQGEPNSGWAQTDNLLDIARDVDGVDAEAADSCRTNDTEWAQSAIDDDVNAAQQSGVRATPAFVLYNTETDTAGKLVGAQPYERFEEAIEQVSDS